ncbi:acetyl-CoA carboxylase biotin carboxylase subunit [Carnobacteriaceae bacterium zg-84]|uniref:acetyl-CoA carboxylase biotin carboxylase subunit n=1 Tax=Granulicatella sp. zg-84 TaxID=2678503 RepID=UPI0013C046F6|nr:acetyl-CoA carboxylase biotin carboxylase subunit [Granulicatella sp. zg-84]NEW66639.1 acetyl-CoA carboxylase biotin carboxylase subunit [Granulicatella sp. zg-84]QMI85038.1 acetyl-CoA carboxylase biotin carboxylase subunit [Carnobacteriaceae bacterium zg-84]
MIKKVLIANRGEIAVRIIRACHELGIETVAIYSKADTDALHVMLANEAICVGNAKSSESYLNKVAILSAAIVTGADAIHPGFGFLSENADFAKMCQELNIVFIGPAASVIDLMGNKANAREAMQKAGVPVIPGSPKSLVNTEDALHWANEIGYPIMLKAVSGGGGKGMRKVYTSDELVSAFQTAQAEALAAFGDNRMYLEKIISPARHIEIQILADKHGHVIHLGERDCSLQRHHQKVLEESPSPYLDAMLREKMGESAVKAATYVGYENAGTIEFLVDEEKNYYFMEMNTRIQVEHPVTEMATDIDIVKWQLRIAGGEMLTVQQKDVALTGHTIECRINAENPSKHFMPSCGTLTFLNLPSGCNGLRVETAMYQEYTIPPFYDAMVAKIIVKDDTREKAIRKMQRALSELFIEGIDTNITFQEAILQDEAFLENRFDIEYLERSFLETFHKKHSIQKSQ